ncbi:hypothetical protein TOPH_05769 [Tolypocladium ophioglossoides CBS 100239]|uniref:ORP1 like protein n=1 Tax=Tolypocladium ophioglossoides (strain CBS 100239) TaxID=1163406 RepID=A0A0L0N6M3_TOLOC|nr:hypothetical protein TOPH_05769 [Tolypocladium ophioglossoides CBS 100239]
MSMLNKSAGSNRCKESSRESTPSFIGGVSTLSSTALPTPSPERASPQTEGEANHFRGRTPWSAGGYSLPLHIESRFRSASTFSHRSTSEQFDSDTSYDTTSGASVHSRNGSMDSDMASRDASLFTRPQPVRAATLDSDNVPVGFSNKSHFRSPFWNARRGAHNDTPVRHKLSDSHSSLSSYSSWQSRCHSRISSITTASGGHGVGSALTDLPILESKLAEHDESTRWQFHGDGKTPLSAVTRHPQPEAIENDEPERPGSPSDAVLNMKGPAKYRQNTRSPCQPFRRAIHLFSAPRLHKRATSAPDLAPASAYLPAHTRKHPYAVLPPPNHAMAISANSPPGARGVSAAAAQAVRDRLEGRDFMIPKNNNGTEARGDEALTPRSTPVAPNSPPELASRCPKHSHSHSLSKDEEPEASKTDKDDPRCMFVANCDTGSQLRKAISHLFGRNKSCTLKIPKEVWVYYCRKHYQRIRYRNARTYPSNQMELVKVQIVRLQAWSEDNKAKGKGPYIKQWTLSLRKREQNRLENGKGILDEGDEDHMAVQGGSAVPDWIIQLLGDGYTTKKMLDIAGRLHQEITEGSLSEVPEIEFLPDIVDDEEGGSTKPVRSRRQNSSNGGQKTPKRKAPDLPNLTRQASANGGGPFPDHHSEEDEDVAELVSPSGKRARIDRVASLSYHRPADLAPRSAHPYMVPAYVDGRAGHSGQLRAPDVVPKIRPLEYNQGYVQGDYDHQGQPRYEQFPHAFNGGQASASFYSSNTDSNAVASAYGQYPRYYHGHNGSDSQFTLPSISAQISGGVNSHQSPMPNQPRGTRFGSNGATRLMHQRSTSAYTPASRHVPSSTRPSSSGNSAQAQAQLSAREPGAVVYDVGAHNPHGLGGGHWMPQQYAQGQGWVPEHGQAYASQQQSFQQAPMYGQSPRQGTVSPRSGSSSYGGMARGPTAFNGAENDV